MPAISETARQEHEGAIRAFNGWIELKAAEGMSRASAVRWIAINRPEVHHRYLHAVNGLNGRPQAAARYAHPIQPAHPAAVTNPGRSASEEVDQKVAVLMNCRGMKRHDAHAKVMRDNPSLRERLVAEANDGRKRA